MDESEKRFERDIEAFLISPQGGYTQFNGQDADGHWVQTRQQDVGKCIYMDVLCEFIAATQPKEWARYTKYYGDKAADKLYHRLEPALPIRACCMFCATVSRIWAASCGCAILSRNPT